MSTRGRKTMVNTLMGILFEVVTVVCSFILPRLILSRFGSAYNGITASITQFVSWVVLLRAGIGGVTRASLYHALAKDDRAEINGIIKATDIFMRKVAMIFLALLFVFACLYPVLVQEDFDWFFTFSLVLIIGSSTFVQNYYGITYKILLQADQRQYITILIEIFTTILNTIVAAALILCGGSIHLVKLGSAVVFILNPLAIHYYARRRYQIDTAAVPDNKALAQRWDAFAQQVCVVINNNSALVILSMLSTLKEASVYTVYHMVINGVAKLVQTCTNNVCAAFGNMMARKEEKALQQNFAMFEWLVFTLVTTLFSITAVMCVPFVRVYTSGVTDVDYVRPMLGCLMTLGLMGNCLKIPYQMMAEAAGHFRQTRNGAIAEACINLTVSIVCAYLFGMVGVVIGTLAATTFRMLQYSIHTSRYILRRSWLYVLKNLLLFYGAFALVLILCLQIPMEAINSYGTWIVYACIVGMVTLICVMLINVVFYRKLMFSTFRKVLGILRKQR